MKNIIPVDIRMPRSRFPSPDRPRPPVRAAAAVIAALLAAPAPPAAAETLCVPVDEFNDAMALGGTFATTATVTFDVTGVNPADYFNGKGGLAQFRDGRCATGASATLKLYGVYDPPNTSHPPGTLKLEYGTLCCADPECLEGWADPNPTPVIFEDGTEACTVSMYLGPDDYGFHIDCDGTIYDGVGENNYGIGVTEAHILGAKGEEGQDIWLMPNAVSTWSEVCYEASGPGVQVVAAAVVEDVTAASWAPAQVFSDVTDLAVGYQDGEIFLKFAVGPIDGRVRTARLLLHSWPDNSGDGDGGDLYRVADNTWSETTLTWNNKPATSGAAIGRVGPVGLDAWYSFDVSAVVMGEGTYSFSVAPRASDANTAHFWSKEGSTDEGPRLRIEYVVVDADGDTFPDGPDCDDDAPLVHPGAAEACNGLDDDCDGATDEGCTADAGDACDAYDGAGDDPYDAAADEAAGSDPYDAAGDERSDEPPLIVPSESGGCTCSAA